MVRNYLYRIYILLAIGITMASCHEPAETSKPGRLALQFEHYANGQPLIFDTMMYKNAAGNVYEVTEIQWFVSDIVLKRKDGTTVMFDSINFAHYVDTNVPGTFLWQIDQEIESGEYSSVTITFGIKGEKNKPGMYTEVPESNMMWPMHMGGEQGGYHYMKLNGFWKNTNGERQPFNFHLGVGQQRDAQDQITGYIQNWFEVELPESSFVVSDNKLTTIGIRMNVEKWWESPNVYDHNMFGGSIMKNQEAMGKGVENGRKVFSFSGTLAGTKEL